MRKLDNKGNASIILCLVITALFGFTALVIDVGLVFSEKTKLSNALDAAALAAVLELPEDRDNAVRIAREYIEKNNIDSSNMIINVSQDNKSISIQGNKEVKHLFAPVIGIKSSAVNVASKAVVGPAKSIKSGIRPFAVQVYDFSYGDLVTLKEGAGDGYHGNYKVLALGGSGSNVFEANALYGYKGTLTVGDWIDTEPGNMTGATNAIKNYINAEYSAFDNFNRDSIRIWTIPLVSDFNVNGRNQLKVAGFAEFYVEDITRKSGKIEVEGRFIRYVTNAVVDMNLQDTGLYGAKLAK